MSPLNPSGDPSSAIPSIAEGRARRDRLRAHLRQTARVMDELVTVPGTRFTIGLDPVIGLVPVVGDVIGLGMGVWLVKEAHYGGVPRPILVRMARNLGIDTVAGFVPLVGDLFDMAWRAHTRNRKLVEDWLATQDQPPVLPAPRRRRRWLWLVAAALASVGAWYLWVA